MKRLVLPRLYVILEAALLTVPETECAEKLAAAGVRLLQYRNKQASARELFESSKRLSSLLIPRGVNFVVNDRADVAVAAGAAGVHVGQEDLGAEAARSVIGDGKLLGVSTHNLEQFKDAAETSADYIAVGPVFSTSTKANPDPVVGIELIHQVRSLTDKPIVAIGGITLERAADVIRAGADSVAVISDILLAPDPAQQVRRYLDILEAANHVAAV
ncbi:MAG TPA: thiamine phosphate synthase [Candidatus Acidoferrum sp.]|nr:thiamine phosphate synthase [Candidatus Acidoferrum sp.]